MVKYTLCNYLLQALPTASWLQNNPHRLPFSFFDAMKYLVSL